MNNGKGREVALIIKKYFQFLRIKDQEKLGS